jgi:B12-binding domain/radical SAM domain protein
VSLRLVVRDGKTAHQAMCVLTAALRVDPRTREVSIRFVDRAVELPAALAEEATRGRVVAAWSFYSMEVPSIEAELADARDAAPDVLHVAGGVHATAEPAATLAMGFDLVGVGEGERSFVELVAALASGRDPRGVEGYAYLDEAGTLRSTGPGPRIELDDYPAFNVPDRRFCPIEITRGCVYACRFCQTPYMFKARFRHRSVANVREHVRVFREHGGGYVRFVTPTSMSYGADGTEPNLDAVEALLAAVREELGPEGRIFFGTFPSEVRPEHVTDASMRLLRRYVDNDNLVIGGQSGSERVLVDSLRGHDVDSVLEAARIAAAHGFRPNVDMLFGLPGEADDDMRATRDLMQRLVEIGARVHAHTFMPLPGTPFADAPPGEVPPELSRDLSRLEAEGRSYGAWRQQIVAAERLGARRRRRGATSLERLWAKRGEG